MEKIDIKEFKKASELINDAIVKTVRMSSNNIVHYAAVTGAIVCYLETWAKMVEKDVHEVIDGFVESLKIVIDDNFKEGQEIQ